MCNVPQPAGFADLEIEDEKAAFDRHRRGVHRLVTVVQQLSLARDLPTISAIVRTAARELTGADGATLVLREGDKCHYADEDAITPLWKGRRFPMASCISGWVMNERVPVTIENVYKDPRIPQDAYRPTFVKSMAMVPIRPESPIGAIGNYWAHHRQPTASEIELLQALANTTSVAIGNVQLHDNLEQRVRERTLQIEDANRELEAFASSVSHDLRGPLHAIDGFVSLLEHKLAALKDAEANDYLSQINRGVKRMTDLTEDLLRLARIAGEGLKPERVDLTQMVVELITRLRIANPERAAVINVQAGLHALADAGLIRIALENLLSNAWKYTSKRGQSVIEFAGGASADGWAQFRVRDNGAGFDPRQAEKLFVPFQRLHRADEFTGTGVGLATVQRIIHRHGGRIWAEGLPERGASFYFTLPAIGPLIS